MLPVSILLVPCVGSKLTYVQLNHIMIMNIHKHLTDELYIVHNIFKANLFIAEHPHRQEIFGSIKPTDMHSL